MGMALPPSEVALLVVDGGARGRCAGGLGVDVVCRHGWPCNGYSFVLFRLVGKVELKFAV